MKLQYQFTRLMEKPGLELKQLCAGAEQAAQKHKKMPECGDENQ